MGNALFQSVCITRFASKAFKLWCAILLFASITANAESNKEDVYYGGFAFCGKAGDVDKNFPISSSLNKPTDDGTPYLGRVAREFFQKNKDHFSRMNLQFGVARREDTSLVLALALTD